MAGVSLRFKRATAGGTAAHFLGLGEMNLCCPDTNSNHQIATRLREATKRMPEEGNQQQPSHGTSFST
jgi:hypothetical protein